MWFMVIAMSWLTAAPAAAEQTWKNVPVIDANCATKMKDNPDRHDRACTLQCARSGYGILVEEGKFLKFDRTGNEKWRAALEKTDRNDHLRATVTGTLEGDTIKVTALSLQ